MRIIFVIVLALIISGQAPAAEQCVILLHGPDDGKVSITAARISGMTDFIIVPTSHPFLMRDKDVMRQVAYVLKYGVFENVRHPG